MYQPRALDPGTDRNGHADLNRLCPRCSQLSREIQNFEQTCSRDWSNPSECFLDYYASSAALETSAREGCHLCTLISQVRNATIRDIEHTLDTDDVIANHVRIENTKSSYQIKIQGHVEEEEEAKTMDIIAHAVTKLFGHASRPKIRVKRYFEMEVVLPYRIEKPRMLKKAKLDIGYGLLKDSSWERRFSSKSTASEPSFEQARRWMRECSESHGKCRKYHPTTNHAEPPTRLVDVGSGDGSVDCRLFSSGTKAETLPYLALSHRWGGADVFKLTKANLESMRTRITMEWLPRTFRDAIHITRQLGFRYLWIDSLCIIQDDPEDWKREASKMAEVYSNCVLTIAALWGNDSHAGCFVERNPLETQDCRIAVVQDQAIYVRSSDSRQGKSLGLVKDKPLLGRKWVLQERLLSPRTLYYGPWELHWECLDLEANETVPSGNVDIWYNQSLKSRFTIFNPLLRSAGFAGANVHEQEELFQLYKIWTDILGEYWSSQLTYHTDILVAISGITTSIASRSRMTLASGMWTENLHLELLWKVENPSGTERTTLCQTWSWASLKGAALSTLSRQIIIKTCVFHLSFNSSVDASGAIRARGPLFHTTLQRSSSSAQGAFLCHDNRLPENTAYHLDVTPSAADDVLDVALLVIAEWQPELEKKDLGPTGEWPGYIGLILAPVEEESSSSTYKRIGIWDHYVSKEKIHIAAEDHRPFQLI
ncbi:MAG: hypothetical protein Q9222_003737 [Ikaeria aurantiellina]